MKLYADYDFCIQEYSQDISQEEFDKYILKASAYIRRLTLLKADSFEGEQLKYAACAVVEAYRDFDRTLVNGRLVSSENNDGYSVSYGDVSSTSAGEKTAEKMRDDKAYAAAKLWLSGTGLLSRRASHVNKCRYHGI